MRPSKILENIFSSGSPRIFKLMICSIFLFTLIVFAVNESGSSFVAAAGSEAQDENGTRRTTKENCEFLQNPVRPKDALMRHREELAQTVQRFTPEAAGDGGIALVAPQDIPRKNYIDTILFNKMGADSIQSAPICTDEEFIRRAYLDLTGRIPAAADVTSFLANTAANKRDTLVDSLIGSPEYVDKWTMFFGDLFRNTYRSVQIVRYSGARDAFYNYIKASVQANKSYAQIATEMITANGDNFVDGATNHIVGGFVSMGPAQDSMDGRAVNTASMFLGINSFDCLYCHDGAGHLNSVNLWGAQKTRMEAWGLAAFFARTNMAATVLSTTPNYRKYTITDRATGEYLLNTNSGNRTNRVPENGVSSVPPKYVFTGQTPNTGEARRVALARMITADKQFARAAVNYIWEKMMVEALVSPSNTFDPARLDKNVQLPSGWSLQPANTDLLEALTNDFIANSFNLQKLIATIAKSNIYQLSAQYPGSWDLSKIPYYARKYARRLDAEEVHDAIMKATGIGVTYQLRDTLGVNTYTVNWAMQLPDPSEPRSGAGNAVSFLNSFVRGDRDVKPRSSEPSILQSLNLMNNSFVMTRIHNANAGSTVSKLIANTAITNQEIITQLYLNTLSRNPTNDEINALNAVFTTMTKREAAEAIQWTVLNKMDFLFNY